MFIYVQISFAHMHATFIRKEGNVQKYFWMRYPQFFSEKILDHEGYLIYKGSDKKKLGTPDIIGISCGVIVAVTTAAVIIRKYIFKGITLNTVYIFTYNLSCVKILENNNVRFCLYLLLRVCLIFQITVGFKTDYL